MSAADAPPISEALVLAAGLGSRIRAVAGDRPKPLIPFGGDAILAHNLRWLGGFGVRKAVVNAHYRAEMIRDAVGDGARFGLRAQVVYEPELLGTAGALRHLAGFQDTALVVYGDNVVRFELSALAAQHRRSGADVTIALFDPARHLNTGIAGGRVAVDGETVTGFVEGGGQIEGLVNAGVYAVSPEVMRYIPKAGFADFGRDVFPAMLAKGAPIGGCVLPADGFCLGLDTPESYAVGENLLNQGRIQL